MKDSGIAFGETTKKSPPKAPHGHVVQFYDTDEELARSVSSFVGPALQRNEGAILIATKSHLEVFEAELSDLGLDVPNLKKSGQLVLLEAKKVLSSFVVDGALDEAAFQRIIGGHIDEIAKRYS